MPGAVDTFGIRLREGALRRGQLIRSRRTSTTASHMPTSSSTPSTPSTAGRSTSTTMTCRCHDGAPAHLPRLRLRRHPTISKFSRDEGRFLVRENAAPRPSARGRIAGGATAAQASDPGRPAPRLVQRQGDSGPTRCTTISRLPFRAAGQLPALERLDGKGGYRINIQPPRRAGFWTA